MLSQFKFLEGEVLLVDKPYEWTSFQVVKKVRYLIQHQIGQKLKVGHAGTLDPLATGLLILCTGKKTKEIEQYQGMEKEYTGTFVLGNTTPSFDLETEVQKEQDISHLTIENLEETKQKFIGKIQQIPPMFSAVKINGKRLYQHARKGEVVEVKPRLINISEFELTRVELPEIDFKITCSKGTYIRSLARDFGEDLEVGAYLSSLRRTRIGTFNVNNAYQIEDFINLFNTPKEEN